MAPAGWRPSGEAAGCGVNRVGRGWRRPVGSWGGRSQAAGLSWQPMKVSAQLSAHHWLVQHQNLQSVCLSGRAWNRTVAGPGRGLGAQGNRSSRSASRGDFPRLLPPTHRLPPSLLEMDQVLPPSPNGCTTQPWAGLLLSGEQKPGQDSGQWLVSCSLGLLLPRMAPRPLVARKGY